MSEAREIAERMSFSSAESLPVGGQALDLMLLQVPKIFRAVFPKKKEESGGGASNEVESHNQSAYNFLEELSTKANFGFSMAFEECENVEALKKLFSKLGGRGNLGADETHVVVSVSDISAESAENLEQFAPNDSSEQFVY